MTAWLLALVPTYGPWLVAAVTFASCLALPVPASILMLTAGGFAAAGDLSLALVSGGALAGAVAGDQTGYWLARWGGGRLHGAALDRARALVVARGLLAVFLTRWLLSPLGPYANAATGAARMNWAGFTLAGVAGEAVWVGVYVGAGFAFGGNLEAATQFAGSIIGFLAAGAVALALGAWLLALARTGH